MLEAENVHCGLAYGIEEAVFSSVRGIIAKGSDIIVAPLKKPVKDFLSNAYGNKGRSSNETS